ncbi:P-loop containing nucleoside triphosphate hydrolase protein [Radiomyces spectabilis]|uniref:P-loop containing nucleoside triphosphate hydrolase protein n=1 Tax=Radiomyces spectabilis TaxID=64574 RepID=UPI00221EF3F0|nr:P-loop containing nucleoside triphosphate hydrolase protein [Radiomyces spectabilis]KAI8371414.1 P-loop containing nucleoside triphosphate hydrolase protein [Radiomyces spectabilis]
MMVGTTTNDAATVVADLLSKINTAPTSEEVDQAARDLAKTIQSGGIIMLKHHAILGKLEASAKNKKSGLEREGGLIAFNALAEILKQQAEPILLKYLPLYLDLYADKGSVVQEAAQLAAEGLINLAPPEAAKAILPLLYEGMGYSADGTRIGAKKWQTKVGALKLLKAYTEKAPEQIGEALPEIIPAVSNCLSDTKNEVANEAQKTMMAVCAVGGNPDIERHLRDLVLCMGDPTRVPNTIEKLASTTFVAEVNGPTLAIMVPLLTRALNERSTLLLRQTLIITDNLCKLVRDPRTAALFLPQLYPGIERQADGAAFPEIRELGNRAKQTLIDAGGHQEKLDAEGTDTEFVLTVEDATKVVKAEVTKAQGFVDSFFSPIINYVGVIAADMVRQEMFVKEKWTKVLSVYLGSFLASIDVPVVCDNLFNYFHNLWKEKTGEDDDSAFDHQEGEELCRVDDFSLAYGTRLLLSHTKLKLHRGQRYGLCGHNGAGKSTLMRAIHQGKVEGFPSQDEVRTAFVDYTVQGADTSLPVVDYVAADKFLQGISREEIEESLRTVGFDQERLAQPVSALSGGWKMKVELARAILSKADILLLDEPTNHLDVTNIKWLEDYLNSQTHVTCLIVSHDSSFLDNVCTQILHYEKRKLRLYSGNLSKFVEVYPAARSYYTLDASSVKFSFPKPSLLQGVRSNTKAILKMTDCTYTYPGTDKPSLYNASASLSLSSRVAVVGPNGAGKSTMIKLLTGETIPQTGVVWRHPALRIGYVAQHAFHHLEQHLEKTPMDYLQWRYSTGEDKEVTEKESRRWTADEAEQMNKPIDVNGEKRKVECLLGRAKLKKTFQYEVKWKDLRHKYNTWFSREKLLELGFQKLVQQFDDKEASREGLLYRELSVPQIRQHFKDIGLDPDIAQYSKMGELSGGQKVKVVIAAAMWNNSHMLVLDEPTNFLDREALGGLATAIKTWDGAVVMISHSQEFVSALCPESWRLENGHLYKEGESAVVEDEKGIDEAAVKAKLSKKKKKTRNEIKAQEARRRERHLKWLIHGGEKEPDTESD